MAAGTHRAGSGASADFSTWREIAVSFAEGEHKTTLGSVLIAYEQHLDRLLREADLDPADEPVHGFWGFYDFLAPLYFRDVIERSMNAADASTARDRPRASAP